MPDIAKFGEAFEKAFDWWLRQGENREFSVWKIAQTNGFFEVFWTAEDGRSGRDRIYKRGRGYELQEVYA